jgi:hypothetical protein
MFYVGSSWYLLLHQQLMIVVVVVHVTIAKIVMFENHVVQCLKLMANPMDRSTHRLSYHDERSIQRLVSAYRESVVEHQKVARNFQKYFHYEVLKKVEDFLQLVIHHAIQPMVVIAI